mgnify:CR=1 FL=1
MALLLSLVLVALGQAQAQHSATTGSIVGTVVDASTHDIEQRLDVYPKHIFANSGTLPEIMQCNENLIN